MHHPILELVQGQLLQLVHTDVLFNPFPPTLLSLWLGYYAGCSRAWRHDNLLNRGPDTNWPLWSNAERWWDISPCFKYYWPGTPQLSRLTCALKWHQLNMKIITPSPHLLFHLKVLVWGCFLFSRCLFVTPISAPGGDVVGHCLSFLLFWTACTLGVYCF